MKKKEVFNYIALILIILNNYKTYYKYMSKQSQQIPKSIITIAKGLDKLSENLATKFAIKLFVTPIKHKIPKREINYYKSCHQEVLTVADIKKSIVVYKNPSINNLQKKVLLVHGWSGRGTQLFKIAEEFLKLGYQVISFDAPSHGNAKGNSTLMIEFISAIKFLAKEYGEFDVMVGHSLGGMSIMNAVFDGVPSRKIVIIGAGDKIEDIVKDFVHKLKLPDHYVARIENHFQKKYQIAMNYFDVYKKAEQSNVPTFIIHDKDDLDVHFTCAENIHKYHPNSQLLLTEGLGHRKILGNQMVINQIINFIES